MEHIDTSQESSSRLRKALFFYLAAALLVMLFSLAATISFTLFDRLKGAEDKSIVHAAQTSAMAIDEWCRRAKDLAWQITSRTRIRQELEKYNHGEISYEAVKSFTEPKLQDAMDLSQDIIGILRLDANQRVMAACGNGADLPTTDKALEAYIFDDIDLLEPLTIKGQLSIVVSAPIRNRSGERQGTDLVILDSDGLQAIANKSKPKGKTSGIIIGYKSNDDITYLFPQSREAVISLSGLDSLGMMKKAFFNAIAGQTGIEHIANTLAAYTPIMESNWGLVIAQGEDELYMPLYRQMAHIGILFLLIYIITLLGFWFLMKPLAGRILLRADGLERTITEKTAVLEQEIVRRTELEKLLQEKEQFLNSVFDAIQDGICVLSPDLKIIHTNRAMQIWYKEHLPLENKACFEVYHGLQHPCPDCPSLRSINSRKIEMQEVPLVQNGCEVGVQELYAFPLYDEDNQLKGVVEYIRDISLRKRAEEALKESEKRFQSFYHATFEGIAITEQDKIIDHNRQFAHILGYENDELVGKVAIELVAEEDRELALENMRSDYDKPHEYRALKKDGSIFPIEINTKVFEYRGKQVRVTAVHDLTELRLAEKALQESEQNMASVLNNTQDGIVRIDRNFRHIFANPALYAATGLLPEQYLGKTNEEIGMPKELCAFWHEIHESVFRNGKPEMVEYTFITANKGERSIQAVVTPEFDKDKEVATIISVMRDITDIKNAESEKNAVIAKLEKALAEIKTLRGFIPICANCKNIRDDTGYWQQIEQYIQDRSDARFSHSLCPKCAKELYPDIDIPCDL